MASKGDTAHAPGAREQSGVAAARACGKLVLLGEHAVLYGAHALALGGLPCGVTATLSRGVGRASLAVPAFGINGALSAPHPAAAAVRRLLELFGVGDEPLAVCIEVAMPAGCGLGSSAAFCVAVCRALDRLYGLDLSLNELIAAARAGEQLFHARSSGVDCAAAALRGVLLYRDNGCPLIRSLRCTLPPLVVAICPRAGTTSGIVTAVAEQRKPALLFQTIDRLVLAAAAALREGNTAQLGQLMDENHMLLRELGVSTPELDQAVLAARDAGALGAKLSGAGGGGALLALCPPEGSARVAQALRQLGLTIVPAMTPG